MPREQYCRGKCTISLWFSRSNLINLLSGYPKLLVLGLDFGETLSVSDFHNVEMVCSFIDVYENELKSNNAVL